MSSTQEPLWSQKLDMLPADARGRIRRYVEEGYGASLGSFHRRLLSNDLVGAVQGADLENLAALPDYVEYLTSYAPRDCHGSPAKVDAWRGIDPAEPDPRQLERDRVDRAVEAFSSHRFDYEVVATGKWRRADRASHPDRTLLREVTLRYEGRDYVRVFAVVFAIHSAEIESVSFGDLLP